MVAKADWVGRPFGLPYFPLTPTFPLLGPLGVVPLPTKWSIDFGDPLDLQRATAPRTRRTRSWSTASPSRCATTVQRMIDGRLARRRSVWFG